MKTLLQRLAQAARRRIVYRRTVAALSRLPQDLRADLDIPPGDARRIARQAVYGA